MDEVFDISKIHLIPTHISGRINAKISDLKITDFGIEFYACAFDLDNKPVSLGIGVENEHFRFFFSHIFVNDLIRDIEDAIFKTHKKIVPKKGSIGHTTDTFYPVAGANSPCDGYVRRSGVDEDWATIRAAAGNAAGVSDTQIYGTGFYFSTTANHLAALYKAIYNFLTDAIGTDSIISAVFSLYGYQKADEKPMTTPPDYNVYVATPAATNNLATGDFQQIGSTPLCDTPVSFSAFSIVAYNDFVLNAAGIANINKTGVSSFGTRSANYDVANVDPTSDWASDCIEGIRVYFADNGSNKPKLVVVHSAVVSSIKKVAGVVQASIKKVGCVAIASVKKVAGVSNT